MQGDSICIGSQGSTGSTLDHTIFFYNPATADRVGVRPFSAGRVWKSFFRGNLWKSLKIPQKSQKDSGIGIPPGQKKIFFGGEILKKIPPVFPGFFLFKKGESLPKDSPLEKSLETLGKSLDVGKSLRIHHFDRIIKQNKTPRKLVVVHASLVSSFIFLLSPFISCVLGNLILCMILL